MKLSAVDAVKVPVQVVIGENELSIAELNELGPGSIVELDSIAGEPVRFYAAGKPFATCEVVVIDENFGLRISRLVDENQED
ncbi:FliM/FliN family flagellar motor switch protein [Spirochaeta dissipatitropha]